MWILVVIALGSAGHPNDIQIHRNLSQEQCAVIVEQLNGLAVARCISPEGRVAERNVESKTLLLRKPPLLVRKAPPVQRNE